MLGVLMVTAVPEKEKETFAALRSRAEIAGIYHSFGEFDFITLIEGEDEENLKQIMDEINSLPMVAYTWLLISSENSPRPSLGMSGKLV